GRHPHDLDAAERLPRESPERLVVTRDDGRLTPLGHAFGELPHDRLDAADDGMVALVREEDLHAPLSEVAAAARSRNATRRAIRSPAWNPSARAWFLRDARRRHARSLAIRSIFSARAPGSSTGTRSSGSRSSGMPATGVAT